VEGDEPLPVVIDFGIAKATTNQRLTDKTLFTAFEMLIGTPAYMSPEQAAFAQRGRGHTQRHLQPGRAALRVAHRLHTPSMPADCWRPVSTRCAV
jgi:serine/threonine protein kinase